MLKTIRIGTRSSKLALWQAYCVQDQLQKIGYTTEIIPFETKGDKILEVTLSKIGSKGVFTEELEQALRVGTIDIAVHSAKDLQAEFSPDLDIIAFGKRAQPQDVLISFDSDFRLQNATQEHTIATSSTRRIAFLKHFYPQVNIMDMRGNLQTRMEKLKYGPAHAMILAYAGVSRMNYDDFIVEVLSEQMFVPPVGQGSIAIQASIDLDEKIKTDILIGCHDTETGYQLTAERSFLKTLQGGCSIPSFGFAQAEDDEDLIMRAGIISLDGKDIVHEIMKFPKIDAEAGGYLLAKKVLKLGGKEILDEIKKAKS